ncbi:hypothetical protein Cylst_3112 [Cylindrospermum stagnale PCC 7417]|uniref:Uncharacterized protein n=1 Tax=Cylindrospermum stagnale PCC 7417 TaxID=56107 RepID=K9WZN8_9NOST|nr:hypothetical protein Cylst_3112 [Cylindrospermum stagnale PCC 7417]
MLRSLYYNFLLQLSENNLTEQLQLVYQLASITASTTEAN